MYVCIEKVNNLRKKYFPIKSSYLKATQKLIQLSFNFMWRSIMYQAFIFRLILKIALKNPQFEIVDQKLLHLSTKVQHVSDTVSPPLVYGLVQIFFSKLHCLNNLL